MDEVESPAYHVQSGRSGPLDSYGSAGFSLQLDVAVLEKVLCVGLTHFAPMWWSVRVEVVLRCSVFSNVFSLPLLFGLMSSREVEGLPVLVSKIRQCPSSLAGRPQLSKLVMGCLCAWSLSGLALEFVCIGRKFLSLLCPPVCSD